MSSDGTASNRRGEHYCVKLRPQPGDTEQVWHLTAAQAAVQKQLGQPFGVP